MIDKIIRTIITIIITLQIVLLFVMFEAKINNFEKQQMQILKKQNQVISILKDGQR